MNRRNFLKLLGLSAVPISMLPAPAQAEPYVTDIRHVRITTHFTDKHRVVIDNSVEPALEDFSRYYGEDWEDWVKWNYRDQNNLFYVPVHSQFFEVSEKSVITIVSPTGNTVTFSLRGDKVFGNYMEQVDVDYIRLTQTLTATLTATQSPHRIS